MKLEDKASLYKTFISVLQDSESESSTEDDKIFRSNTKEQITNRDEKYTDLLSHFVGITKVRNILKEIFKWSFYIALISSVVVLVCMTKSIFNMYIKEASIQQMIESIPLLITSIVGFVSVIITIPVTITKYLFSTKEDEYITQIILHAQDHDTSGREWTSKVKEIANVIEDSKVQSDINIDEKMKKYEEKAQK